MLNMEETHVYYVFDESRDLIEVFCVYGGYGMTCEQVQCLAKEDSLIFW
ncbi:hypothetical protein CK203_105510 [Vitis vinifera]|uniref:Uncharacterized protein n=1 Tax=Vitis vinifera TaxID=29760 RepID=A0A438FGN7_VITVI|nr:hypothetical protein CK203_105510 [Vitis vinifera]